MLDKAKERLSGLANLSFAEEDGQALTFPSSHFDAVICSMGLMLFDDPKRGLSEFHRVLRDDGWCAVSVNLSPETSYITRVLAAIARYVPDLAAGAAQYYSLGDAGTLRTLFEAAGFRDVTTAKEVSRFPYPSFEAYFAPTEEGFGGIGLQFKALPPALRDAVRSDVRHELGGDGGGPIEVPVEILMASGRKLPETKQRRQ